MTHWIYKQYQDLADTVRKGVVLKTDAWQEHKGDGSEIKADYYVEILPNVCEKAQELGFNVIKGSVVALPFQDNYFDTVIDTSTIDHVLNYGSVLKEYKRVLKEDGNFMIVVWTTDLPTHTESLKDASGGEQHLFNKEEFEKCLKETINKPFDTQTLWSLSLHKTLMCYKTKLEDKQND
jgi:ubiquinone/menaquinone biosynthesis C-methylase UbiE